MQEKNRNTLLRAIQQLPDHQPPESLWEELKGHLDQRAAEQPLRRALSNLPDHHPPAFIWENISEAVENERSEEVLHQAIAGLQEYDPPDLLWDAIAAELPGEKSAAEPRKTIKLIPVWRRPAIAAGITALLCALAWLVVAPSSTDKVSIAYATVKMDSPLDDGKEEIRDQEAFQMVVNEFQQQLALSDDPYLAELKLELEDLDLAKRQLQEVMGAYGDDEELIQKITQIEHQRSKVLKEMVTQI